MKTITINSKKYGTKICFVDDEDYEYLNQFNWSLRKSDHTFYAERRDCSLSRRGRTIRMHVDILKSTHGQIIDHIDMNGLNNQRANLRFCTQAQNLRNRIKPKSFMGKSMLSAYKGVTLDKINNKWRAQIGFNNKHINIGRFKTEIEAAKAYNEKAKELFGEFANLNII